MKQEQILLQGSFLLHDIAFMLEHHLSQEEVLQIRIKSLEQHNLPEKLAFHNQKLFDNIYQRIKKTTKSKKYMLRADTITKILISICANRSYEFIKTRNDFFLLRFFDWLIKIFNEDIYNECILEKNYRIARIIYNFLSNVN